RPRRRGYSLARSPSPPQPDAAPAVAGLPQLHLRPSTPHDRDRGIDVAGPSTPGGGTLPMDQALLRENTDLLSLSMNHGKRSDRFVLHMQHGIVRSGSKSQCAPRMASRLSISRPTPDPSQEGSRRSSASCQFPSWEGLGRVHGPNTAATRRQIRESLNHVAAA